MDAEITVESELGVGSCFYVRAPLVPVQDEVEATVESPANPTGVEKAHLLVIESNPMSQSLLRVALQSEVAAITVTGALADGLAFAQSERFDLIVFAFDGAADQVGKLEAGITSQSGFMCATDSKNIGRALQSICWRTLKSGTCKRTGFGIP
jgi:hypothetical protein